MEAAWAGLTVEESNLAVQIAALRRVLGEEPGGENWIETLPRRGYRLPQQGGAHLRSSAEFLALTCRRAARLRATVRRSSRRLRQQVRRSHLSRARPGLCFQRVSRYAATKRRGIKPRPPRQCGL